MIENHEGAAEEFDVALLDVGLPDGSGTDLAKKLRAVHPDVAIVIFSGDDSDDALLAARPIRVARLSRYTRSPQADRICWLTRGTGRCRECASKRTKERRR